MFMNRSKNARSNMSQGDRADGSPANVASLLSAQRAGLKWPRMAVTSMPEGDRLCRHSTFAAPPPTLADLERLASASQLLDRAMGALTGLAVADSIGHPLEFVAVAPETGKGTAAWSLEAFAADRSANPAVLSPKTAWGLSALYRKGKPKHSSLPFAPGYTQPFNKFGLDAGQWTDDTSMALCMADSLLKCGKFDGSDVRLFFWSWWFTSLNNAFRKDKRRVRPFLG